MILIACSQSKLKAAAPARELYTGQAFRLARQLAEQNGRDYLILSALHGLVDPAQQLDPYELFLGSAGKAYRTSWAAKVNHQLAELGIVRAVALAGSTYCEGLNIELERPLKGLGIGRQLGFLSAALKAGTF